MQVRRVDVPEAPRLTRLTIDGLGWLLTNEHETWPGVVSIMKRIGVGSLTHVSTHYYPSWDARTEAITNGPASTSIVSLTSFKGLKALRVDAEDDGGVVLDVPEVRGNIPYQIDAVLRPFDGDMTHLMVEVDWKNEDGAMIGTDVLDAFSFPSPDWEQASYAVQSPAGAKSAAVRFLSEERGTFFIDAFGFRVDGPYVIPWTTPGWNGGYEIEPRVLFEILVAAHVGGAQDVVDWPGTGYGGGDLQAVAQASIVLAQVEHIIADGQPIPNARLAVNGAHVMGMEYSGDAVIVVARLAPESDIVFLDYRPEHPGAIERIREDGSRTLLGSLLDGALPLEFPEDDGESSRAWVLHFVRERCGSDCETLMDPLDGGAADAGAADAGDDDAAGLVDAGCGCSTGDPPTLLSFLLTVPILRRRLRPRGRAREFRRV